jgi:phthiocerol/phenolphthiocerol synthesis type-I polyketide synthase C
MNYVQSDLTARGAHELPRSRLPIAVIGVSGRYPGGANDLGRLWHNLKTGLDGITDLRGDRWDLGYHNPDVAAGGIYTRCAGLLDQVDGFDADFFSISPREAVYVDPQQRLLLELAWEALEDGALIPRRLRGSSTGVFIGIAGHDYADMQNYLRRSQRSPYVNSGSALSIAANRISYFFDFHGPSLAIDTACSSALVALHQACLSLWSGDCSLALVGGVNMLLQPKPSVGFCSAGMISPSGRCRSFDARADGYVRSEGGGVVVLKSLPDAERDGNPIKAVIIGTALGSDGRTAGLSLPNEDAQEALLRQVYSECGLAAEDVFYVEAHGTGTSVGDPIECKALGRVLGLPRRDGSKCLVGSIKSNIGHLETAAGMAGLTKVLLALQHRELPGNLHFETPNPRIDFNELRLQIVDSTVQIPEGKRPLVMGVSSYGFGGTNAHVVVSEYRNPRARGSARSQAGQSGIREQVLLLSAKGGAALRGMAASYANFLRAAEPDAFAGICATAALCRSVHSHRLAVAGTSGSEMAERLDRFAVGEPTKRLATGHAPAQPLRLAYVFSGNGSQWWGMGRELLLKAPAFRAEVDRLDTICKTLAGWSVVDEMLRPETQSRMDRTEFAQPALFALQVGIARMLTDAGVRPSAVIGHSVGEVAAAYVAGALSLEQAIRVVYERSRAQAKTAGAGKMAAVGLGAGDVASVIAGISDGWIEIAAINSDRAVTVAGEARALDALGEKVIAAGAYYRLLDLDYAFHSRAMDVIEVPFRGALASLNPGRTNVPFVSAVEGRPVDSNEMDVDYWWRNIRSPVQFHAAIEHLMADGAINVFLEIGPQPVLQDYIRQCAKNQGISAALISTLRHRGIPGLTEPELDDLSAAILRCHAHGVSDLDTLYERPATPMPLPSYPWQRQRFWSGVNPLPEIAVYSRRDHPLLGYRIESGEFIWENTLDTSLLPYLKDHVVQGAVLMPAAGFIEMAIAAATQIFGPGACELEDFEIRRALVIPPGQAPFVQLSVDEEDGSFKIRSRSNAEDKAWVLHVAGRLTRAPQNASHELVSIDGLREKLTHVTDKRHHYNHAEALGFSFGPTFQVIESIRLASDEALGEFRMSEGLDAQQAEYCLHPCALDACLQLLIALPTPKNEKTQSTYLPVQIGRARFFRFASEIGFCHSKVKRKTARSLMADIRALSPAGEIIAEMEDVRFLGVDFLRSTALPIYAHRWEPANRDAPVAGRATPLSPPSVIARRLAPKIDTLVARHARLAHYHDFAPRFDEVAAILAARALQLLAPGDQHFSLDTLVRLGSIPAEQRSYLQRLVEIARDAGFIEETSEGWRFATERILPDPSLRWRELLGDFPAYAAELALLAHGDRIVAALQGSADETPFIFSEAASGLAEHFYDGAPGLRVYNDIARAVVTELLRNYPPDRQLRILELGGGSAGLTAAVLPILPPQRTEYLFTDCSQSALTRAEQRFSAFRSVRCRLLDFDRDLIEQDVKVGQFDLVFAGDALHLASDLSKALARAKELLAPGGILLLIEPHPQTSADVVFGQSPRWWRSTDDERRGRGPLLSAQQWRRILCEAGFLDPALLSDASAAAARFADPHRSVILAQSPFTPPAPAGLTKLAKPRTLLLLVDRSSAAETFVRSTASALQEVGARVITVKTGESPYDFSRLVEELRELETDCSEIVHLAGLTPIEDRSCESLAALQDMRCVSTLLLVQALSRSSLAKKPRLTLVTSQAVAAPSGVAPLDPGQAAVWGLGRVLAVEHSELRCRLIDLQSDLDGASARSLARELIADDTESEILLTASERYVNRLHATSIAEQARQALRPAKPERAHTPEQSSFRLEFSAHGSLDNLFVSAAERRAPGPGEIEIRVRASGLNFRDVMWVMGMLPEDAIENGFAGATIGLECAGEVSRLGPEVTDFAVGDRVLAFAGGCFAQFVTTSKASVARLPADMSFEEGATVPTAFMTAYYALCHIAALARGERILIHGAAGGVGMAAIQIAKRCGAQIFGTAGSSEKRDLLRLLGVNHVLDSRSLTFADEVMRLTKGEGVDVVLNSLAGEALARNFRILKPFGRFLEIGKRDLYANRKVGLRPFRNNISFFAIDADSLLTRRTTLATRLMRETIELFEKRELHPLPYRSFPFSRAVEAFRQMQQSRHIGKLVISVEDDPDMAVIRPNAGIRQDGTYLITGGLSGFGLATARWLAEQGAHHFALVGRRGASTEEAQAGISALERAGAGVRVFAVDVCDKAAVAAMMDEVRKAMPPLRGVIHAAMVLDDGIVLNLNPERMHKVMAPKVQGAWNLHRATLDQPLDFFVLYSSLSTFIGSPGQANYVAGNLFLESLAQYRRTRGLPALAVAWGPLADVGVLARNPQLSEASRKSVGAEEIFPAQALAQLDALLAADATCVCAARLDWARVAQRLPQNAKSRLIPLAGDETRGGSADDLRTRLERLPPAERRQHLVEAIKEHMGRVLGIRATEIDIDRPLLELGLDSLMGVELSEVMTRENIPIPVMELIQSGSISNMAERILRSIDSAGGRSRRIMLPW